jgi:hypothetical protein
MTLTLELSPTVEQSLQQTAQANGQSVADYAVALLEHAAQVHPRIADVAQRAEIAGDLMALDELDALAARWTAHTPPLVDDAVERAYREREDAQL